MLTRGEGRVDPEYPVPANFLAVGIFTPGGRFSADINFNYGKRHDHRLIKTSLKMSQRFKFQLQFAARHTSG